MSHGHGHGKKTPLGVRLGRASLQAYQNGWAFLAVFILVFVASLFTLAYFDLLPEDPTDESANETETTPLVVQWEPGVAVAGEAPETTGGELPTRIEIPAIGLKTTVSNPTSTSIEVLDKNLLSGAVRYPTSGKVGAEGNAVIFGHSSYLPVVSNKNFKAFNNIQKLRDGDRITVYAKERAYVYEVESVVKADAETGAIPLSVDGAKLTLATCNSFGEKTDRFVVTATLVDSRVI